MNKLLFFLFLLLSACQVKEAKKESTNKKPNFIVLLADDQAWAGTSVLMDNNNLLSKSDYYETPNLERLAQIGTKFSRCYLMI